METMVKAVELRAGDQLVGETTEGKTYQTLVHGILIHNWSTTQDKVTVFTRHADYDYDGQAFVMVQR